MQAVQRPITTGALALPVIGLLIGCAAQPRKQAFVAAYLSACQQLGLAPSKLADPKLF